jgi:hypothetical protein
MNSPINKKSSRRQSSVVRQPALSSGNPHYQSSQPIRTISESESNQESEDESNIADAEPEEPGIDVEEVVMNDDMVSNHGDPANIPLPPSVPPTPSQVIDLSVISLASPATQAAVPTSSPRRTANLIPSNTVNMGPGVIPPPGINRVPTPPPQPAIVVIQPEIANIQGEIPEVQQEAEVQQEQPAPEQNDQMDHDHQGEMPELVEEAEEAEAPAPVHRARPKLSTNLDTSFPIHEPLDEDELLDRPDHMGVLVPTVVHKNKTTRENINNDINFFINHLAEGTTKTQVYQAIRSTFECNPRQLSVFNNDAYSGNNYGLSAKITLGTTTSKHLTTLFNILNGDEKMWVGNRAAHPNIDTAELNNVNFFRAHPTVRGRRGPPPVHHRVQR